MTIRQDSSIVCFCLSCQASFFVSFLCMMACLVDVTVEYGLTNEVRRQWTEEVSEVNNWQTYNVWTCNAPLSQDRYLVIGSVATYLSETVVTMNSSLGLMFQKTVNERFLSFTTIRQESESSDGNESWIYSPKVNSWWKVESANRPTAREGYRLVTLCDTIVVLLGGLQKSHFFLDDVWMFDTIDEVWKEITVINRHFSPLTHILESATVPGEDKYNRCRCNESVFVFSRKLSQSHVYKLACVTDNLIYTYQWMKTSFVSTTVPADYLPATFSYNPTTRNIFAMAAEGLWCYSTNDNVWQLQNKSAKTTDSSALGILFKNADTKVTDRYVLFVKGLTRESKAVWVYDVMRDRWSHETMVGSLPPRFYTSLPPIASFWGRLLTYLGTVKPCNYILWELRPNTDNKVWTWNKIQTQTLFPPTQILPLTDMNNDRLYTLGGQLNHNYYADGMDYKSDETDFWQLNLNEMMWQRLQPFPNRFARFIGIKDSEVAASGGLLHDGTVFVVCGEVVGLSSAGELLNTQGYVFQTRAWLIYDSNIQPSARNFHKMVAISESSLLMFGGLSAEKNQVALNETWIMTLREGDSSFVYWLQVAQNSIAPQARTDHTMVKVSKDLVILYGGSTSKTGSCFNDVWHFNVTLKSWSPVFLVNRGPRVTGQYNCYSTGAVVGSQVFFAFRCETYSKHCYESRIRVGLQIWMYSPRSRSWSFVSALRTSDNTWSYATFYWERNLFILDSSNQQIIHTHLGCPAGYESLDISSTQFPCEKCKIGYFSAAGAKKCSRCPIGLVTINTTSTSILDCSKCDVKQCEHGECLVVQMDAMPRPTCRCQFGYTGSSCQYATYYLIGLGIVVFVALLVAAVGTIIYIRAKKRRREALLLRQVDELNIVWQIGDDEIELGDRIGSGGFGDVFRARYRDLIVAVKILRCPEDEKVGYEFERESQFMQTIRHSNIVMFLGAGKFTETSTPFIVIEYVENGSVRDLLDDIDRVITVAQKFGFCLDVAKGMSFLHTRNSPRIHRDLKCSNLLVSRNGTVKIADFGLGRQITSNRRSSSSYATYTSTATSPIYTSIAMSVLNIGTARWRAPELCDRKSYSTAVDVYSFAIVMWEIWTRLLPFAGYRFDHQIDDAVSDGERPRIPTDTPADYRQLMIDCWQHDPTNRPTFAAIYQRLHVLLNEPLTVI